MLFFSVSQLSNSQEVPLNLFFTLSITTFLFKLPMTVLIELTKILDGSTILLVK